ncbi:mechanosensitive ion channel family protein [Dyella sp.]|uniref:mechanosensitive ion channel family protein n=1 Tax=Dyella sp. TaxID=1869338 RepID=UPI002D7691E5|nr:mechanosensitive ion channel family protein [Dyella sp.]HET7331110.1 mechanosensitive ion channel family protein [Dyella sp.]
MVFDNHQRDAVFLPHYHMASDRAFFAAMDLLPSVILSGFDIGFLAVAALLLACGFVRRLRPYRALLWGGSGLLLITAIYPRHGNPLGRYLFVGADGTSRIPPELLTVIWWILGAWLLKSLLDLILRRTIFPDDNQPHARQLFADLASALIYVLAFVGIMDVVFKQPVSTVLATSGVLAIVLALALQSTLADVFSGLAINIERSFGAGDWIAMKDGVEGQIIEVNWRATRIKTCSNDLVVVPNSVIAKSIVTNHCRLNVPQLCTIRVQVHHGEPPARVISALEEAAGKAAYLTGGIKPSACACRFDDAMIVYELTFAAADFTTISVVQSRVITQVETTLHDLGIDIGNPVVDMRGLRFNRGSADAMGPVRTVGG